MVSLRKLNKKNEERNTSKPSQFLIEFRDKSKFLNFNNPPSPLGISFNALFDKSIFTKGARERGGREIRGEEVGETGEGESIQEGKESILLLEARRCVRWEGFWISSKVVSWLSETSRCAHAEGRKLGPRGEQINKRRNLKANQNKTKQINKEIKINK